MAQALEIGHWPLVIPRQAGAAMRDALKRLAKRLLRSVLSWASLLAIPAGIAVGLHGWRTLGALLILGGTLCYFLVDPVLMLLDLFSRKRRRDRS